MDWQRLRDSIYYLDGSLRDIYIHRTTKEDWLIWSDFVNQNYKVSFYSYKTDVKQDKIDIYSVFEFWDSINESGATATVFIDQIKINVHFFSEEEIENDITPTEIDSIEDHTKLVDYMIKISKALDKKITLSPENSPEIELIAVNRKVVTITSM